ncbi:MAG: FMN-binding negative transcriptional regulator [Planctomycetota bacterium]
MLQNRFDAPLSDDEWRAFLAEQTFGQLVVPARPYPLVFPTHYVYGTERGVEFHLHRKNPAFGALAGGDRVVFSVVDAQAYVPTGWNVDERADPAWAAPTSYYAAVQVLGRAAVLDDPTDVADVLNRQLLRLQPEGGHHPVEPGANPFGRMLRAIAAVRVGVEEVRAKFKFGGNRTDAERARIGLGLAQRGSDDDLRALAHLSRRGGVPPLPEQE